MIKVMRASECPGFVLTDNDQIQMYDFPSFYNFKIGDQIHLRMAFTTFVYEVSDIKPANLLDYHPDTTLVTATRMA